MTVIFFLFEIIVIKTKKVSKKILELEKLAF